MIVLLLLLGPVILGAKLLGASWLVALFIGLSLPLAMVVIALMGAAVLDTRDYWERRKLINERRREAGLAPLPPWYRRSK